jgi:NADPH:quinone reductase-like Zn-dependent oxidoreductase
VNVPARMDAVVFDEFGGPEKLHRVSVPVPRPEPDEVLVEVHAVSVGRTLDIETRAGRLPFASRMALPHVLGADHAGRIAAVGENVGFVDVGTRVGVFPVLKCDTCRACAAGRPEGCAGLELVGVHRPGAYAQYCAVPATNTFPLPDDVSYAEACALALNSAVARRQLELTSAEPGEWVFVHAAGGGLGAALVALARYRGLRVIASARREWKRDRLRDLGADLVVDPGEADLIERVRAVTDGVGATAVVDNVADPKQWQRNQRIVAPGGTIVGSGALTPDARVELDARDLYLRNVSVRGTRTARLEDARAVWKDAASGLRAPVDDSGHTLDDAAEAHRRLEQGDNFGRVVLAVR